ncbi:MAG: hypothetical protein L0216_00705 [Planctomycetales bacterium]|nr:hypothetical protein [Planctomycetales bacterium]
MRRVLGALAVAGAALAAGCDRPEVVARGPDKIYYMTRPEFTWQHQAGRRYSFTLTEEGAWQVVGGRRVPAIRASKTGYELGRWRPDFDLNWRKSYLLNVETTDEAGRKLNMGIAFRIDFQVPTLRSPADRAAVASLEPTFTWIRAEQANCRYQFQIADNDTFATVLADRRDIEWDKILGRRYGPDQRPDTADDEYVAFYTPDVTLLPRGTYYWRVRCQYYSGEGPGAHEIGDGDWSPTRIFTVTPQPDLGSELLESLAPVTTSPDEEINPDVSANSDIVCQRRRRVEGGAVFSDIVMFKARVQGDQLTYEKGVQRVTEGVGTSYDREPKWDEKGAGVLFASDRFERKFSVLYRKLAGRSIEVKTTHTTDAYSPAMSPDGQRIAYVAEDDKRNPSIWVMNADGTGATQLTNGMTPTWSPDGKRIAFTLFDPVTGNNNIWIMDADGSAKKQLTQVGDNTRPAWSPNARRIAYVSNRGENSNRDVWLMDIEEGAGERQVTNYLGPDSGPAWTPDGRWLVFHSKRNTNEYNVWMGRVRD